MLNKEFFGRIIITKNEIEHEILSAVNSNTTKVITYFNQNSFNLFHSNKDYKRIINDFIIFSDGIGMNKAIKFLFNKKAEKFNATDLYSYIFDQFFISELPVYIIGGNFNSLGIFKKCENKLLLFCIF